MKRHMHRLSILITMAALSGCSNTSATGGPPRDKLYFPTGLAHVDVAGKEEGVLFVANANFDKRYGTGSIVAINLDSLGLPAVGASPAGVKEFPTLNIDPSASVQIASFSGEMALQPVGPNSYRIIVPTRSEGMYVFRTMASVSANGVPTLSCVGESSQNCFDTGASLSPREFEQSDAGIPRAPSPYGVAIANRSCTVDLDCCATDAGDPVCGRTCTAGQCVGLDNLPFADVWVTHLTQADSPLLSGLNLQGFLVRLDSDTFSVNENNFLPIGQGGTNSVVVLDGWTYVTGRILLPAPNLLRAVNRDGVVLSTALENTYRVSDARGSAVSSDGKRLYLIGRAPDTLLILSIDKSGVLPNVNFMRAVGLPGGPNDVKVIARPGKGDLVAISCTNANSVALYDDEVGDLVSQVPGVGVQPYSIAVDLRGAGARLFVSAFGDGRIGVIDLPDLNHPQDARLVAHLGAQQLCLTRGVSSPGCLALQGAP